MNRSTGPRGPLLRAVLALVLLGALGVTGYALDAPLWIRRSMEWIDSLGYAGGALFVALYALLSVMLVPGSVSTLTAGAVFGVVQGTIYASLGATLGATLAFFVARYLGRDAVMRLVQRKPILHAIDQAIDRDGWKMVGLLRLSPIVPWSMSNYLYGITAVRPLGYILATWAGMLPGTIVYVYIGSMLGVAAGRGIGGAEETGMTPGQWVLTVAGLIATLIVMRMIGRSVRAALDRKIGEEPRAT